MFTQYAEWGQRLAAHLTRTTRTPVECYHGGLTRTARDQILENFNAQEGPGVLVLHLGDLQAFSSTTLKTLRKLAAKYQQAGSGIVITGAGEEARQTLLRTGLLEAFGAANIVGDDPHLGADLDAGLERGRALLAELRGSPAA